MGRRRKREYEYLVGLRLGADADVAILDGEGKYRKWDNRWKDTDNRCKITSNGDKLRGAVRSYSECRETVCNSWSTFLSGAHLPTGCYFTDKMPRNARGTSILAYTLTNSDVIDEYYYWQDRRPTAFVQRLTSLILERDKQKELVLLMDVLLGTVAMLIAGPSGFTRRKANPIGKLSSYKETNNPMTRATRTLEYNGISNFWIHSPAHLSLMLGLGRTCIDFYAEGKFSRIDKKIKLSSQHKRLAAMSKKKVLSQGDKLILRLILSRFKSYFSTKKVKEFPGHYPLNPYTWTMFTDRLLKMRLSPKGIRSRWQSVGPYGITDGGFYQWCQDQKKQTRTFQKRKQSLNWG